MSSSPNISAEAERAGPAPAGERARRRRVVAWIGAAAFAVVLAIPHVSRLGHPSLFGDDVVRIADLQTKPLRAILFSQFNEHMAPLFDLVSWVTWQLSGRWLPNAPLAFTVATVLPFALCLVGLGWLTRRESGSLAASLAAVAGFGISEVHVVETVWWYSGSNHMWALLAALVALLGAGRPGTRAAWMSGLGAFVAPMGSAMGLVTGPAAAVMALTTADRRPKGWNRLLAVFWPLLGTGFYVGLGFCLKLGAAAAESVARWFDFKSGLIATCRAPVDVMIPGLVGVKGLETWLPKYVDLGIFAVLLVVTLIWALRSRRRPAILAGLTMILGGYLLIYPFRSLYGPEGTLRVARYHLFPECGLALIVASALAPFSRWLDVRPIVSWAVGLLAAGGMLALQFTELRRESDLYNYPEQAPALAALERVARVCRERGITRAQALEALDPVWTRWQPLETLNVLTMLPETVTSARIPDDQVRGAIFSALSLDERKALCGGMNVARRLRPATELEKQQVVTVAEGQPVSASMLRTAREPGKFLTRGWPSSCVFGFDRPHPEARFLVLPVLDPNGGVDVWWSPDDNDKTWSELRSVHWNPDLSHPQPWGVALADLPHWDPKEALFLRVTFRYPGLVHLGPPRLLAPVAEERRPPAQ